jgi:hypothetical protein
MVSEKFRMKITLDFRVYVATMFSCVIVLMAVVVTAGESGDTKSRGVHIYYVEPFSTNLPENSPPLELIEPGFPDPIVLTMTPGEISSSVLIGVSVEMDVEFIEVTPSGIEGSQGVSGRWIDARVVKMMPRNNRFMQALIQRVGPTYGPMWPDALVHDEFEFDSQVRSFHAHTSLSLRLGGPAKAAAESGHTKYFILTTSVPAETQAGTYSCDVIVSSGSAGDTIRVPIRIRVLDFRLPLPEKILSISNDFGDPQSPFYRVCLEELATHGMNTSRLTSVAVSSRRDSLMRELEDMGFETVIHHDRPETREQVVHEVHGVRQYFYGIDEPQPKGGQGRDSWDRMAEHVRLSRHIHQLGGKVVTSLPHPLAMELTQKEGPLYQTLRDYGEGDLFEPLDWANYTLALQHVERHGEEDRRAPRIDRQPPRRRGMPPLARDVFRGSTSSGEIGRSTLKREAGSALAVALPQSNEQLWNYMESLYEEYRDGRIDRKGRPLSKNNWVETYYFPLGFMRSPYFARLLFGFFLFDTQLDGVMGWTLYRPRGNPYTDDDGPDAIIAYPTREGMISTYHLEAVREGVNDLRYCRKLEMLLLELKKRDSERFQPLWYRFLEIVSPYKSLLVSGARIDRVIPISLFRQTRQEVVGLIEEVRAGSR